MPRATRRMPYPSLVRYAAEKQADAQNIVAAYLLPNAVKFASAVRGQKTSGCSWYRLRATLPNAVLQGLSMNTFEAIRMVRYKNCNVYVSVGVGS